MSGPDTANTAASGSHVGVQAGHVHDSVIYVVGPDDPPERDYEVGCRYLADGVPVKAREHLERAYARGFDGPEIHFHRALAILSKRSYRDLTKEDRAVLAELSARRRTPLGRNEWWRGLDIVFGLLSCVDGSGGDPADTMIRLDALPTVQRDLILRHLGLVLTGSMKQGVWHQIREGAKLEQHAHERVDRAWVYFEPVPAGARAGRPKPKSTALRDIFGGLILASTFLFPVTVMMKSALAQGSLLSLISCFAMLVFGPAAGWHIAFWNHKHRRRLAKEQEYGYRRSRTGPPERGFADHVERAFDHYFAKYAPEPENRDEWLSQTIGVRRSLRDEVARVYRESSVRNGAVNWLIRFMVRDVRRRWTKGLPLEPDEIHAVGTAAKARCVILCLLSAAATMTALSIAFQESPVSTVGCVLLAVVAGRFAIPLWLRIHSEHRRYKEENREQEDVLTARKAEYERWKGKLEALMPTETEMEAWLNADKTLILNEALKHHRLAWSEVTTHAFLPTADRPCKSASVRGGPWRHSKYEIRVFLVTNEGVREATAKLDFERARWHRSERDNYRFEALSSVRVQIKSARRYTLNITLTNGPAKSIPVSDTPVHDQGDEEPQAEASDINLDAAGFSHTLRILEGMAAEGKPWFERATDPPPAFASERPETDAPSDAGATSPTRNGTARREQSTQPLPAAPVR
ncbi:SUI1 family translation initiation factor [Nocardiopsis lucentensis]|uniref:hypothetical protein n=1 Tax=Nocardiopsis lucentensis TaxID=53441 RepID=UPI0003479332|nr:hypothetical protein [Nocardiopsis lucentensis]